jgi:polysaccharide biosynthesis transport protein
VVPIHHLPIAEPLSPFGEAIRWLRTSISMINGEQPTVIQLTSALPREGKTTIALSLAASAAAANVKVLFIDADLRHPAATRLLGLEQLPGLADLLSGKATIENIVQPARQGGYLCVGAGTKVDSPTDVLGSTQMKMMIASVKQSYDLVIVDTPPVGPVMDGVIVSAYCDKVILVVKWGSTHREFVKASVELLSSRKNLAGVAFNKVDDRQARTYGLKAYARYRASSYYSKYYSRS